ncbi:hypothetical protein COO60DRAFT_254198 [Scenedesmus sp. NREL 46B-D3]|nr:hypothetical protein COO60DRAFT_254198 [Scenedesmus sp. NREL 46B-D3]
MSNIHSAGQYELDYLPHRLGNWQVWDSKKLEPSTSAKAAQTQQRQATGFLVDDRGHILPGVKKVKNSFRTRLSPIYSAPCGWPKPSPAVGSPPAAIMGYKGIITSYLPRNHTVVKAVEAKGATEAKHTKSAG